MPLADVVRRGIPKAALAVFCIALAAVPVPGVSAQQSWWSEIVEGDRTPPPREGAAEALRDKDPEESNAARLAEERRRAEELAAADEAERRRRAAETERIEAERQRFVALESLCHEDLKSIVVDATGRDLTAEKSLYYDHIYQYVEEYPHWKYVGGGLIGMAYKKNLRSGNMQIEGSTDAEGENHVSLHLSGTGNLDGMPLTIGIADGAYGYLMVPTNGEYWHATFLDIEKIRVLTTMAGEIVEVPRRSLRGNSLSFLKVTPRRENPLGTALIRTSLRDRWRGIERRYMEGGETVYERPGDENLWLRTINASQARTVEIAGMERRQRVLCRYEYGPIAATNDERFRPRIERELNAWAARHRAAAEAKERAEEVIHFAEVPRDAGEEFRVRGRCGVVELKFPTSSSAINRDRSRQRRRYSQITGVTTYNGTFYVDGDLIVNGTRFPVHATLRKFHDAPAARVDALGRSALDALRKREFLSVDLGGGIGRDCDWAPEGQPRKPDTCWLRAQRQVLEKAGCDP